ncbi:MAG TPA: DNA gyrase/topoisomerase IV subunit A [Flavobacteriales bacterium]|nr:DNA gyrase/topoisomerase IV subunit A [Flavobacteriales bacterium]|tara:strand:+ start:764 stop:3487 length:2724 start_codon:yes stop_codon:yes gene_type:complete
MSEQEHHDDERDDEFAGEEGAGDAGEMERVIPVRGMYNDYFLDYASYVILERAVPHQHDGLKPVQRRILHSLREMDDGRFHKVANVIGNTMKYHPHGDASIGDAMVQIGQRELLLDCQGNWGNILTGDRAAAPRYIEVKLSKFALEVLFNAKTTTWLSSYDGRNKEPETLPVKFPLLLSSGVDGIAVGLACKILPYNFIELIDACIAHYQNKRFKLYPDFPTGGMADMENYNDGLRGDRVRVRARIDKVDNKTLAVREVPYGVTTGSLIDSILKANDKGKIKIKKVEDNTADKVEVVVHLANNVSPDKTLDALYAFTDCEVSLAPNSCVVFDDKPVFMGATEILKISADRTRHLLKRELEIELGELQETWHFASLEKIFIENRIYRDIEECETWEEILTAIHEGLKPHIKHLLREVTDEDVTRLTEIRIKRISKFDSFKADERIASLEGEIERVKDHLAHLTEYAIAWFKRLKEKYGAGRERKTELRTFESIDRSKVAVANAKLYWNPEEGFVGTGLKRAEGELLGDCSDIDDIIVFRKDGVMQVSKVSSKAFFGKNLLYAAVWKRGDKRTTYNVIYLDGATGRSMVKRFNVTSITRDREYPITKGTPKSKVLYFTANPNGEAEVVSIYLRAQARLKKVKFDVNFSDIAIKGRGAGGNLVSKFPVRKVELKEAGVSTLGARKVWYDDTVRRLNADGRGRFLGDFKAEDKILLLLDDGSYAFSGFDLSTHFDDKMIHLEKFDEDRPVSVVYHEGEKDEWYVKRFLPEFSKNPTGFIGENEQSKLWVASTLHHPHVRIRYNRRFKHTRDREDDVLDLRGFISLKGVKALGNKLSALPVTEVSLEPPVEELEQALEQELEAARAADAAREATTETPPEAAPAMPEAQPAPAAKAPSKAPELDEGGQASLF